MSTEPVMPGFTCPDIDKAIKQVNSIQKIIKRLNLHSADVDELKTAINDIDWEISDIEDQLETLRDQNHQLRACAEFWQGNYERMVNADQTESSEIPSSPKYTWGSVDEYCNLTGYTVNEPFRMGWSIARSITA